ncbi:MAG: hypothetical protein U0470_13095 [Anaerolineae bacterium]
MADDLVNGVTAPNRVVSISVFRPLINANSQAQATADANGNFSRLRGEFEPAAQRQPGRSRSTRAGTP